ncbi:MAG: GntR family transcriptional regulator [Parasporobacterium sp.]|nr:GntR family transcriptional regulator [Parasporobacterium sp.]
MVMYSWNSKQAVGSDEIFEDMLTKIEKLQYMPGEMISESTLCVTYNTTRHAVRGALVKLKDMGLVDVLPQRGTFVSLIDLQYIEDVLYMREAIEQETVSRLMDLENRDKLIKDLKNCVKEQKKIKDFKAGVDDFYALDDRFHELMLEAVGRKKVNLLYAEHFIHVRRWRNIEVETLDRIATLPDEHEKIIEAIENRDREEAHRLIHDHIDSVRRYSQKVKDVKAQYFV